MGERVALRKAGRVHKGLCPFHAEKTPSFNVDPDRRTYKCFGCGEGGDVFDWIIKMEGLDKAEALKVLAERAGVELATRRAPQEQERTKRLLAIHETAHFYFRQALRGTDRGKAGYGYLLSERGITAEASEKFGLGYAPDLRDGLLAYLRKKGYGDDEALASGVILTTERGLFDRFRERLIIPIRDGRGRIIAFGGRAMRQDQPAKYVNSPQTQLFNKSGTLYGLDLARPAIRRQNEVVIVEGYFDAIACHQAGLENVVASMGTALTADQYRILDGLKVERAVVAFDPDAAGTSSAEKRGRDLVHLVTRYQQGATSTDTGLTVHVAQLPVDAGDPDDLARADPGRLRRILDQAKPVLDFVIERVASRYRLGEPDGRRRFLAEALPLLVDEPSAITREVYFGKLSTLTGVPQERLRDEAFAASRTKSSSQRPVRAQAQADPVPDQPKQGGSMERYLMAQLIQYPEEAARIDLSRDDLGSPEHWAIFEHLRSGGRPSTAPIDLQAAIAALEDKAMEPASGDEPGRGIEIAALRLRERNLRQRLGEKRAALARANGGDVGGLDDEVARTAEELFQVQREREGRTVLRGGMENE